MLWARIPKALEMRQRGVKLAVQAAGRAASALSQANAGAALASRHLHTAAAALASAPAAAAAHAGQAHGSAPTALFHSQTHQVGCEELPRQACLFADEVV